MMKVFLVSFLAASTGAFSVVPVAKNSVTKLSYYKEDSRFDVVGDQREMVLAEKQGPATLQGGAHVGWTMGQEECDIDDPSCGVYIAPHFDVQGQQGALENAVPNGAFKAAQGGATNDWSQDSSGWVGTPEFVEPELVSALSGGAPAPTSGDYLSNL